MALEWEQVIVAAADPAALGSWWQQALGWVVVDEGEHEYEIRPAAHRLPGLLFVRMADADPGAAKTAKRAKDRLHLDFRPEDQGVEVERLVALGATPVDIGQGDVSWVVLADPEGNEFCVLSSAR